MPTTKRRRRTTRTRSTSTRKSERVLYAPKDPPARSHLWTKFAKRLVQEAVSRTGQNESTITEYLVRRYAGSLRSDDFASEPAQRVQHETARD